MNDFEHFITIAKYASIKAIESILKVLEARLDEKVLVFINIFTFQMLQDINPDIAIYFIKKY